jgi:hypothetical protein
MKTIDLATKTQTVDELLTLAEAQNILIRTADGRIFLVAEIEEGDTDDTFAQEVELTRQNTELMKLLGERSNEPGRYSSDQVREKLGLNKRSS